MIIIDGYNVIHQWKSLGRFLGDINVARARLIGMLSNYAGYTGEKITIVFDSSARERVQYGDTCETSEQVCIVYAPSRQGADIFIAGMTGSDELKDSPFGVVVVTDDSLVRTAAASNGAVLRTPEKFEREVLSVLGEG